MEVSDEQLMLAYQTGDAGAFETLYARHRGGLFRFVLRSVKERGSAEELFQDTWMRVIDARARYRPQARFATWLYTIAHNRVVDHWRGKGPLTVSLDDPDAPPGEPSAGVASDPARRAQAREDLTRFAAALAALPAAQREAFLLHEEAGLSLGEIAQVTGTNEEAAKSRLRYALAKLREAIDGD